MGRPVAHPGFPRGGSTNPPGGANIRFCQIFFQKLHKIERIWTHRGDARPSRPPLDPPLQTDPKIHSVIPGAIFGSAVEKGLPPIPHGRCFHVQAYLVQ